MTNKTRVLFLLQYLKDQTDEGKAVTNMDVLDSRDQFFEGLTVNSVSGYCVYGLKDNNPQSFAI